MTAPAPRNHPAENTHPAPTPAPVAVPEETRRAWNEIDKALDPRLRAPRPEPVVAPLPSEAVEALADVIVATMQRFDNAVPDAAKRMVAWGYAQSIVAAGYRLVPEDDEPAILGVEVDRRLDDGSTFVRIERQGMPLVQGYVHPVPPEDDEDTVRERIAQAIEAEIIRPAPMKHLSSVVDTYRHAARIARAR